MIFALLMTAFAVDYDPLVATQYGNSWMPTHDVGDLNGDGLADIAVGLRRLDVILGAGGGRGALAGPDFTVDVDGSIMEGVTAGDLDGDGMADLAITTAGYVHIFYGPLGSNLVASDADAVIEGTSWSITGDLKIMPDQDGDGGGELVFLDPLGLWVLPSGRYSGVLTRDMSTMGFIDIDFGNDYLDADEMMLFPDRDGDGLDEIALINSGVMLVISSPSNTVGTGVAASMQARSIGLEPGGSWDTGSEMGLGDLNGDGRTDISLSVTHLRWRTEIYVIDGDTLDTLDNSTADPRAVGMRILPPQRALSSRCPIVADYDGSGHAELVIPSLVGDRLWIVPGERLVGRTSGDTVQLNRLPFIETTSYSSLGNTEIRALGDHNGNGRPGLIMVNGVQPNGLTLTAF